MILQFKTKRNAYGHRNYLAIDTGKKTYTTLDTHVITEGAELKTTDYYKLLEQLKEEFQEVERI